jgi:hypothetical protein
MTVIVAIFSADLRPGSLGAQVAISVTLRTSRYGAASTALINAKLGTSGRTSTVRRRKEAGYLS